MHRIGKQWIALVAVVVAGACGGQGDGDKAAKQKDAGPEALELAGVETVLRDMLGESAPEDTVYVSFGKSWEDPVDPPPGFVARFGDVSATLLPVTEYGPQPGRTPLLLIVHAGTQGENTETRVDATFYRYGAGSAHGYSARLARVGEQWQVVERTDPWWR